MSLVSELTATILRNNIFTKLQTVKTFVTAVILTDQ